MRFLGCVIEKKAGVVFFLYAAFLVALSVSKSLGLFKPDIRLLQAILGGDKATHLIAVGVLGFIASFLVDYSKRTVWLNKLLVIFFILASLLLVDELLQIFLKNRVFDMHDLYYGWSGALFGLISGGFINFLIHKRVKSNI